MAIPIVLFLAAGFWIVISVVKYWYYRRFQINYTYKLDDKLLAEMRAPSTKFKEKFEKLQKEREKNRDYDEPILSYKLSDGIKQNFSKNSTSNIKRDIFDGHFKGTDKSNMRPMDFFEEMESLNNRDKEKNKKQDAPKYDRSMFEDPVSKLYRELQNERKEKMTSGGGQPDSSKPQNSTENDFFYESSSQSQSSLSSEDEIW